MPKSPTEVETERYHLCRNLAWETAPDGRPVPGRYCANRLGVVQHLDCPVFQGVDCCLFDPREDGEDPSPTGDEDIDRIRTRLARDYLRWPYWRRVDLLRGPEAPPGEVEDLPDVIEAGAAEEVEKEPETEEPETEVQERGVPETEVPEKAPAPKPPRTPPGDEALKERYPGQRRSEEERRSRRPGEDDSPLDIDEGFVAGIFDETPEAQAAQETPAEPQAETADKPADTPAEGVGEEPEKKPESKRRRRRRRPRRRRGRGKGRPPPKSE